MPAQPSRREVLRAACLGASAALLAACTGSSVPEAPPPAPTPDEAARTGAARREESLAVRATATAKRHPTLAIAAGAARAHAAHASALAETLTPTPGPSGASPSGGTPASVPAVPADKSDAARALAAAEDAAGQAHRTTLANTAVTGGLARLLASVAASDAAFAVAVRAEGDA